MIISVGSLCGFVPYVIPPLYITLRDITFYQFIVKYIRI